MGERVVIYDLNGEDYLDFEVTPFGAFVDVGEGDKVSSINITLEQLRNLHFNLGAILQDVEYGKEIKERA